MRGSGALLSAVLSASLVAQTPKPPPVNAPPATRPLGAQEQRELLGSVDAILQFASEDSGLAIRKRVRPRLVSREQVTRYLTERFSEDESAKRLERSQLVLKKFGLLPREFDLKPFLLRLLTEQIAGYYDSKTKTVNLLNWVAAEEQKPVLAHELTHALQDQAVGLERWSDSGVHGVARTTTEQAEHVRRDEWETARDAVSEGQAMLVYTDYALRGTHHTLVDSPEVLERLLTADAGAGTEGSPVLAEAPRVLQESLLFPYTEGLAFEAALLRDGGKPRAFAEALARPPASSYEVMTPQAYLAHEAVPVLRLPDLNAVLGADWLPYDVGVIGELDVRMLVESYGDADEAKALTPMWRGGAYYAAQRRGAREEEARRTGSLGLAYVSKWKDADAASRFMAMYAAGFRRRYRSVVAAEGKPKGSGAEEVAFETEDGFVTVAMKGRAVVALESFTPEEAERMERVLLEAGDEVGKDSGTSVAAGSKRPPHALLALMPELAAAAHYTLIKPRQSSGGDRRVKVARR